MTAIVTEMSKVGRKLRRPQHRFRVDFHPFQIQPIAIAPVLPGETLQNVLLQARVLTDVIKEPLIGWWSEVYIWYVKHRDLDDRDAMVDMMLEPGDVGANALSALNSAAVAEHYHYASSYDWVGACMKRVTKEFFRDESESWNVAVRGNLPLARINADSWMDSLISEAAVGEGNDFDDPSDNMETLDAYRRAFDLQRRMTMSDMTYEDFLRTYGVQGPAVEEPHRPELIRYVRDWSYPTYSTAQPSGNPGSVVSWAMQERADKKRFFPEPGFIFAVMVARPKVYTSRQRGAGVHMMDNAYAWLPAVLADDPATSLRQYAPADGPLATDTAAGYWVDVRDLLIYGDQFITNTTAGENGNVPLPTTALNKRYPADADVDALFVDDDPGTAVLVHADGVLDLSILGHQIDHT